MDKPAKVVEARDGESLEEVGERFKRWRETRGRGEGASAGSPAHRRGQVFLFSQGKRKDLTPNLYDPKFVL